MDIYLTLINYEIFIHYKMLTEKDIAGQCSCPNFVVAHSPVKHILALLFPYPIQS